METLQNVPDEELDGVCNYLITKILVQSYTYPISYRHINRAIGTLECAKMEFYRRVAAPYEDIKIQENGDVY